MAKVKVGEKAQLMIYYPDGQERNVGEVKYQGIDSGCLIFSKDDELRMLSPGLAWVLHKQ